MLVLPIHSGSTFIKVYTMNCQIELKKSTLAETQTHVALVYVTTTVECYGVASLIL